MLSPFFEEMLTRALVSDSDGDSLMGGLSDMHMVMQAVAGRGRGNNNDGQSGSHSEPLECKCGPAFGQYMEAACAKEFSSMPTSSSADGGGPQEPFPRAPSLSQVDPSLSFDDFIHKERQSRHVCVWEGRRLRVLAAPTGEWLDATLCILKQTALTTVTPQPVLSPFGLFGFGGGFFPHPIFSAKTDIDINWECIIQFDEPAKARAAAMLPPKFKKQMGVVDLRKKLEEYGAPTHGRKKELQARLQKVLRCCKRGDDESALVTSTSISSVGEGKRETDTGTAQPLEAGQMRYHICFATPHAGAGASGGNETETGPIGTLVDALDPRRKLAFQWTSPAPRMRGIPCPLCRAIQPHRTDHHDSGYESASENKNENEHEKNLEERRKDENMNDEDKAKVKPEFKSSECRAGTSTGTGTCTPNEALAEAAWYVLQRLRHGFKHISVNIADQYICSTDSAYACKEDVEHVLSMQLQADATTTDSNTTALVEVSSEAFDSIDLEGNAMQVKQRKIWSLVHKHTHEDDDGSTAAAAAAAAVGTQSDIRRSAHTHVPHGNTVGQSKGKKISMMKLEIQAANEEKEHARVTANARVEPKGNAIGGKERGRQTKEEEERENEVKALPWNKTASKLQVDKSVIWRSPRLDMLIRRIADRQTHCMLYKLRRKWYEQQQQQSVNLYQHPNAYRYQYQGKRKEKGKAAKQRCSNVGTSDSDSDGNVSPFFDCPICLSRCRGDVRSVLTCGHCLCRDCWRQWKSVKFPTAYTPTPSDTAYLVDDPAALRAHRRELLRVLRQNFEQHDHTRFCHGHSWEEFQEALGQIKPPMDYLHDCFDKMVALLNEGKLTELWQYMVSLPSLSGLFSPGTLQQSILHYGSVVFIQVYISALKHCENDMVGSLCMSTSNSDSESDSDSDSDTNGKCQGKGKAQAKRKGGWVTMDASMARALIRCSESVCLRAIADRYDSDGYMEEALELYTQVAAINLEAILAHGDGRHSSTSSPILCMKKCKLAYLSTCCAMIEAYKHEGRFFEAMDEYMHALTCVQQWELYGCSSEAAFVFGTAFRYLGYLKNIRGNDLLYEGILEAFMGFCEDHFQLDEAFTERQKKELLEKIQQDEKRDEAKMKKSKSKSKSKMTKTTKTKTNSNVKAGNKKRKAARARGRDSGKSESSSSSSFPSSSKSKRTRRRR